MLGHSGTTHERVEMAESAARRVRERTLDRTIRRLIGS